MLLIAGAGSLHAQAVTVIPDKTARQIESIRSRAEKEISDADKKMERDTKKGEEKARELASQTFSYKLYKTTHRMPASGILSYKGIFIFPYV